MQAVDTNAVVRYLVGGDPKQAAAARALIGSRPVFISKTVLLEVEWALWGVYGFAPSRTVPALRSLAGVPGVTVENASAVAQAMDWAEHGVGFADALHLASAAECTSFVTF